jgi:hypothetical protein
MYGDFSVAINMSGLNARLFPAPFALLNAFQRSPARCATEALQGASPLLCKALIAPRPVARLGEKNVPQ